MERTLAFGRIKRAAVAAGFALRIVPADHDVQFGVQRILQRVDGVLDLGAAQSFAVDVDQFVAYF